MIYNGENIDNNEAGPSSRHSASEVEFDDSDKDKDYVPTQEEQHALNANESEGSSISPTISKSRAWRKRQCEKNSESSRCDLSKSQLEIER